MKQKLIYLFSLMLMCILGTSGALATQTTLISDVTLPDVPTSTLDLSSQTTFTADDNGWIVMIATEAIPSSVPTWFAINGSRGTQSPQSNFTASSNTTTAPFVDCSTGLKINKYSPDAAIRFTGAEKASFLVSARSTTSNKEMDIALFTYDGTTQTQVGSTLITSSKDPQELLFSGLDADKTYIAYIYGGSAGQNGSLMEIALKAPTKTVATQAFAGVKQGSTTLTENTDYTISENTITLGAAYASVTAPTDIKLINHITYTDESSEDKDVAVELGETASEGYFSGSVTIGLTTYTVKVPEDVPASAPTITTDLESAYSVQKGKTQTLSVVAENASSYQWYLNNSAVDGATSASYTYTAGSTVGATDEVYCVASNAAGSTNSNVATITVTGSNACKLYEAKYSNGFNAFIDESAKTVTVYYMEGESAPTVSSTDVSEGATIDTSDASQIVVTAEDETTTATYAVTATAVTPYSGTGVQFDGSESWIKTGNAYITTNNDKTYYAWVINRQLKNTETRDTDNRVQAGRTRIYFFVGNAQSITLTNDRGTALSSARNIKVYVNGELQSSPTSMPKYDATNLASITIATGAPAMVEISSDQNSGDTGWGTIAVTAAVAPSFTTDLAATASATVGTAKTFTVAADGADSYQWYTCDDAEGTNAEAIEGETSASYEYTAAAEGTEYIFCAATNSVGTTNSTVCAVTAEAAAVVLNVSAIINNQTGTLLEEEELVQGTQVNFGVDANGARVDANSDDAVIIIDAKYHSDHGLSNFSTLQVKAPGAVKIYIGECTYSTGNIVVKNSANETVAEVTPEATCWKNDHTKVAEITYEGEATTLSISGMGYCPFIGVESITVEPETTDFDNTPATFSWTVGNESEATIAGGVSSAVKSTKVKVGSDLTVGTNSTYAANPGNTMVTYQPGTGNAGNVAADMVEYTIKVAKGVTFTPTSVTYDAVKDGTDNASYSWSYTVDGTESDITTVVGSSNAETNQILRNNKTAPPALNHVETITGASEGQVVTVRFYVSGFGNTKKFALSNVQINGVLNGSPEQRSFTDFKVDFRTNPYTTILPTTGELPTGVEVTVPSYNGAQHGAQGATTIVVPVDGPVKFTIGNCGYSTKMTVTNSANETIAEVANNGACENPVSDISTATYNSYATYTYNNESADVLTFTLNGYLPYFFAEACDYIESVDVKYYDVDGTTLIGTESVEGGSDLVYAYGAADVTVASGKAFRGWFDGAGTTALKVAEGTPVTEDIKLYAKTSEIEVAEVGKVFNYELNKQYFYAEDHELFSASNGSFHDATHGWSFGSNGSFSVQVAGNAQVVLGLCQYSNEGVINVTDANNTPVGSIASAKASVDGATTAFNYEGEATTLTFTFANGAYVHNVKVYNVNELPVKDEATGYYIVPANDAASFIVALNYANAEATSSNPAKIFLPNGFYDLGNTCLTSVSSNVSIIGESQNGVTIKNAPLEEGIGLTATLLFTGNDIYLQDLALQCSNESCSTPAASRCVAIQDKGTRNIAKNVSLLSTQDTYYSNGGASQRAFFDNCYITGTVDFLCGGGDVVFNNTTLYVLERSSANVIAAPNTDANTQWGYVMLNCTIDGHSGQANKYNIARPWNGSPAATWINTTCKLLPSSAAYTSMTGGLVLRFHEYNTQDANGSAITGHNLTACGGASTSDALYIDEATASTYTIENVLSGSDSWNPEAIVAQATVVKTSVANNVVTVPEGIYLVEKDGNFVEIFNGTSYKYDNTGKYTLRMANERGGFGEAVEMISGAAAPEVDGETITLTVSANMNGYRAYVNTESNYTVDENTQVYLPVSKTNNEVNLEPIEIAVVPANMPVILVTSAEPNTDGTYTITLTTTDDDASEVDAIQYLQLTEEGVAVNGYRLGYKASSGVKFYKYVATNPEPGKIYLNMSDLPEGTPSADALQIEFELEATGINEVGAAKAVVDGKFIKAGKLVIFKAGKAFNAAGATLK